MGWQGIAENLWLVEGLQASIHPTKKEGKRVDNGMLLRKRKAQAARSGPASTESGEPPKKRTRTSKAAGKENTEGDATAQTSELPALPLPQLDVIQPTDAPGAVEQPLNKTAKLELMGVDSPFSGMDVLASAAAQPSTRASAAPATASPEVVRRSARQANRRLPAGAASGASTPMTDITSLPGTLSPVPSVPAEVEEVQRPPMTRARSSSASSGSSTAVSETGSAGDTAVEPDSVETEGHAKTKSGGKRKRAEEDVDIEGDAEKAPVRTSGRVRKPAKKALHVDEDATAIKKAVVVATAPETKRARVRRS